MTDLAAGVLLAIVNGLVVAGVFKLFEDRAARRFAEFQASLDREAVEHETRFTKLHEKQAEVIPELYGQLVRTQRALQDWLYDGPMDLVKFEEKRSAAIGAADTLYQYFEENRLFLSAKVSTRLLTFKTHVHSVESELLKASMLSPTKDEISFEDPAFRAFVVAMANASATTDGRIGELRRELESDCREMLGYPDADFDDSET